MKALYPVIIVLSLAMCGCGENDPKKLVSPKPLFSIDCTDAGLGKLSAGFVMDWIAKLADENGGSVLGVLHGEERDIEFYFHAGNGDDSMHEICHIVADFRKEGIFFNEEALLPNEFSDRLALYAETARLTESTASLIVAASDFWKMKDCMENFQIPYDNGIRHLRFPLRNP